MPQYQMASAASQADTGMAARGLVAETFPLAACAGSASIPTTSTTTGTLVLTLLPCRPGVVITNLICFVTTTGTSLTFVKLGLFDSAGVFLKATAESSASFNTGASAFKVTALTSTYTTTATPIYAGYLQFGSGATGATLVRALSLTGTSAAIGSGAGVSGGVATQTDISGDVTIAAASTAYYFAAS